MFVQIQVPRPHTPVACYARGLRGRPNSTDLSEIVYELAYKVYERQAAKATLLTNLDKKSTLEGPIEHVSKELEIDRILSLQMRITHGLRARSRTKGPAL